MFSEEEKKKKKNRTKRKRDVYRERREEEGAWKMGGERVRLAGAKPGSGVVTAHKSNTRLNSGDEEHHQPFSTLGFHAP